MSELITKLAIIDFDGTMVDTGLPETGMPIWKEKTGTDYPHKGWWGREESLDMKVFNWPVYDDMVEVYEEEMARANTHVVMMTGRLAKLDKHVISILDYYGLEFDDYRFMTGGGTIKSKSRDLEKFKVRFPNLELIEMWDDRTSHIVEFQAWGDAQDVPFKINHVHTDI